MAFEVDYIPVGEGERSGDAIALRFGDFSSAATQNVVVIDGGFQESGISLVEHIRKHYGTSRVDLVISTHPDIDHSSGLRVILEETSVGAILMHKPWEHASDIKNLFKNGRITASGLKEKLENSLQCASDIEALAKRKGIAISEPFQGVKGFGGLMHVLGPAQDFYQSLLPHFRGTPLPTKPLAFLTPIKEAAKTAVRWIEDHVEIDLLNDDEDTTSAENNTSTIVLFTIDGHKLLFTGDAGKTALSQAADYAEVNGVTLSDLRLLHVPHHGSRRNLNSNVLKRIRGGSAFISASKDSPKHPSKKITNALQKHGMRVFTNCGGPIYHKDDTTLLRPDWSYATPVPFHALIEE